MEEKIVYEGEVVDETKFERWIRQRIAKAKAAVFKVVDFAVENPLLTAIVVGSASSAISKGASAYKTFAEDRRRRRDFFDPRTGMHVLTRRNLDSQETAYVDRRYRAGDSYAQIFNDMKVLK